MVDNNSVLIYSPDISNRLRYTFDLLFYDLANISVKYTSDKEYFINFPSAKINYSFEKLAHELIFIKSHSLLFEKDIDKKNIAEIFTNSNDDGGDIPAKVFLCVSRYEEYNLKASELDSHSRFKSSASFAVRYGFLHKPMVQIWLNQLLAKLQLHYPNLIFKLPTYRYQPTFDIDVAWQFKNRSRLRSSVGFAKDILKGHFNSLKERFKSFDKNYMDAYDTFNTLKQIHKEGTKPIYFWLVGDYGRFDRNIYWKEPALKKLIYEIGKENSVGIHPSYKTNNNLKQLQKEIYRFEMLSNNRAKLSRQHFLKLSFPDTYRKLIFNEITDDFTMGYADALGFRASMAVPFYWFDVERDEVTRLKIHPFQVMDVTLKNYLKLSPDVAITEVKKIIEEVKMINGEFCTLWHNTSLSETPEWRGWTKVYPEIVENAQ